MPGNKFLSGCVAAIALVLSALSAAAAPHGGGMGGGGGYHGGGGGGHGGGGGGYAGHGHGGGVRFYRSPRAFRGFYDDLGYGYYGYGGNCYWSPRWHRRVCPGY